MNNNVCRVHRTTKLGSTIDKYNQITLTEVASRLSYTSCCSGLYVGLTLCVFKTFIAVVGDHQKKEQRKKSSVTYMHCIIALKGNSCTVHVCTSGAHSPVLVPNPVNCIYQSWRQTCLTLSNCSSIITTE